MAKKVLSVLIVVLFVSSLASAATLMLELDSRTPGGSPSTNWAPTVGSGAGELTEDSVAKDMGYPQGMEPVLDTASEDFDFYQFTQAAQATQGGGMVGSQTAGLGDGTSNDPLYFDYTDAYTVEAWCQATAWNNYQMAQIVGDCRGNQSGYQLVARCDYDGEGNPFDMGFQFDYRDNKGTGPNSRFLVQPERNLRIGRWYHVVATYDPAPMIADPCTLPDLAITVYQDCVASPVQYDTSVNTTIGLLPVQDPNFLPVAQEPYCTTVGMQDVNHHGYGDSWRKVFGGGIAVVRLYSGALSASEIQAQHDADVASGLPEPATCVLLGLGALAAIRSRK